MDKINVIGGGLAGVEAAWQAAEKGAQVKLYEMRPVVQTPAHRTDLLAEIVCSNSLKSDEKGSAPYLLKEELRRGNSLVMEAAEAIRKEYSFVPESLYRSERGKVLRSFLTREFIYYTRVMRESHEEAARINIENEIEELSSK